MGGDSSAKSRKRAPAAKPRAKAVAAKRKGGRPSWKPTDEQREEVGRYTAMGFTQEQVARLLGVSVDALAKHCRSELDNGAMIVNAAVAGRLFAKAMSGDTASLIFWCKTRLGWKESSAVEHSGAISVEIVRLG